MLFSARYRFIRIFTFSLCMVFLLCSCSHTQTDSISTTEPSSAVDFTSDGKENECATEVVNEQSVSQENASYFKNAVFFCIDTDKMLFKKNADEKIAPASLTKILTACVAYHYISPETKFTVGTELDFLKPHSSICRINKGDILTLQDLTTGLLMASGNDAAYTIAVNTARLINSKEELSDTQAVSFFCDLMNAYADGLGMKNSNFSNPDGWDDDRQYTTVSDLLILAEHALTIRPIQDIVSCREKHVVFASGQEMTWMNSNQLLDPDSKHHNEYAVGMKTGTTKNAGNCLIASFFKNNKTYIGIVCGCDTSDSRYEYMNYFFEKYAG